MFIQGYSWQPDTPDQRTLYHYVKRLADLPSEIAIHRLYLLLVDANVLTDLDTKNALKRIVEDSSFTHRGIFIINRIFFTICNRWYLQRERSVALRNLILKLEHVVLSNAQNKVRRILHRTLEQYRSSDLYQALQRHMHLLDTPEEPKAPPRVFADYFPQYFFLYVSATQTPDIQDLKRYGKENLGSGVEQRQMERLRQFRHQLRDFWHTSASGGPSANPTNLPDADLRRAIRCFAPELQGDRWQRYATDFNDQTWRVPNMATYRALMKDHVLRPIQSSSAKNTRWFSREVENILSSVGEDHIPVSPGLEILPFQRLINAVCHYSDQPGGEYFLFWLDAQPRRLASFFLNMIMACKMARFDLEKRLAWLYQKLAGQSGQLMHKLVAFFDHMNVALALNARRLGYYPVTSDPMMSTSF